MASGATFWDDPTFWADVYRAVHLVMRAHQAWHRWCCPLIQRSSLHPPFPPHHMDSSTDSPSPGTPSDFPPFDDETSDAIRPCRDCPIQMTNWTPVCPFEVPKPSYICFVYCYILLIHPFLPILSIAVSSYSQGFLMRCRDFWACCLAQDSVALCCS